MRKILSSMDRFDLVLNELSRAVEENDKKYWRLSARRGERYNDSYLGVNADDYAILVFAETEKRLDFAKKVATVYGCNYKITAHENAPEGGEFECKIFIEED